MKRRRGNSRKQQNIVGQILDQQELDDFLAGKQGDDLEIPLITFSETPADAAGDPGDFQDGLPSDVDAERMNWTEGIRGDSMDCGNPGLIQETSGYQGEPDLFVEQYPQFQEEQEDLCPVSAGWQEENGRQPDEGAVPEVLQEVQHEQDGYEFWDLGEYETMLPQGSNEKKRVRKTVYRIRRIAVAAILLVLCLGMGGTYAWYKYITHRSVYSEEREVMVPYYLYLLNAQSTAAFQLQVMNMHPKEQKQVVFCVSNEPVEEELKYSVGRVSDFEYELELAYTANIPLEYTIYSLETVDSEAEADVVTSHDMGASGTVNKYWKKRIATGDTQATPLEKAADSDSRADEYNIGVYGNDYGDSGVVNIGGYEFYADDIEPDTKLRLRTTPQANMSNNYEKHYYLMEIDWNSTVTNFSDYLKETDLAYVIVKAKQPKPEVKAGN